MLMPCYGIRDPQQSVDAVEQHILLDGFKRYRCAVKLGIGIVPYVSLATDEACGGLLLIFMGGVRPVATSRIYCCCLLKR
jgi:hypothetical protein